MGTQPKNQPGAWGRSTTVMGTGDFERLDRRFRAVFPELGPPQICRAPGRVNLLGEHIDYNHLPVLPVTLNRHIAVAFAPAATSIRGQGAPLHAQRPHHF